MLVFNAPAHSRPRCAMLHDPGSPCLTCWEHLYAVGQPWRVICWGRCTARWSSCLSASLNVEGTAQLICKHTPLLKVVAWRNTWVLPSQTSKGCSAVKGKGMGSGEQCQGRVAHDQQPETPSSANSPNSKASNVLTVASPLDAEFALKGPAGSKMRAAVRKRMQAHAM